MAATLRVYKLGDFPGGFGQDEAVVLYDAWSLLTTGAEHHGDRWPLNAREYGDYPSALPSYYMMPLVALFGPSPYVHRLFGALLNAAAVFIFGLLVRRLFRSNAAGLFAATLLAIAPWNIFFSRWAVSAGYCTFFQALGLWLLHRLLIDDDHRRRTLLAATGVGVALYLWTHAYLSQYLFAPFTIGIAFLLWRKSNWPRILVAGGVYSALMLLTLWERLGLPEANGRLQTQSVLYAKYPLEQFLSNYWDYQSFSFLFNAPPMMALHSLRGVPHIPHLFWPLYLLGIAALLAALFWPRRLLGLLNLPSAATDQSYWRNTAIWLLTASALAPLASAIFISELYTARVTHLLLHVLSIIALGCVVVWQLLHRLPIRFAGVAFAVIFLCYAGQQTIKTAKGLIRNNVYLKYDLQHGLKEVMQYLAQQAPFRSVHLPELHQGYIYHLCFTPIHPTQLNYTELATQPIQTNAVWRYNEVNKIGNYYFNQTLDTNEIMHTATLRHQVKDNHRIWYDLYERNGDWFVLRHD